MEVDSGSDLTDIDQLDQEVTPSQVTPAKRKAATRKKEYRPTGSLQPPHLSNFSAYSLYDWINNDLIELEPEYVVHVINIHLQLNFMFDIKIPKGCCLARLETDQTNRFLTGVLVSLRENGCIN